MTTIFNFQIDDVDGEIFKRIDNTEAFINKFGVLHKRYTNQLIDIKTYKPNKGSYRFKIKDKQYYLNKVLKQLFGESINENKDDGIKQLFKEKPIIDKNKIIESKQERIKKLGQWKNHFIVKDNPNDLKQIKEYNGRLIKDCYYYSDEQFKLYHKIENTDLYFEIKDKRADLSEMYKYDRKYYKVKTIENKSITFVLYRKNK